MATTPFQTEDYATPAATVVERLHTDAIHGLDEREAERRYESDGPNALETTARRTLAAVILAQLRSPVVIVLCTANAISIGLGEYFDAAAIAVVVVINTVLGTILERQAERSMLALATLSIGTATVLRDGRRRVIDAVRLVAGDIVELEAGDVVQADGRLMEAIQLLVDESALTGESLPVSKDVATVEQGSALADRTNMLYRSTHVRDGKGRMVVTATGSRTEVGRIATLVASARQNTTPLEKRLQALTIRMVVLTMAVATVVFVSGLIAGRSAAHLVTIILALAVAAIPEGLPIVATIALARGMLAMARRNVVVKYLSAVETIGSVDVICTDKTGTLTENAVVVDDIVTRLRHTRMTDDVGSYADVKAVLETGALCNNATLDEERSIGDPLEIALLAAARRGRVDTAALRTARRRLAEIPFTSTSKMMATIHDDAGLRRIHVKGAVEVLLEHCVHDDGTPLDADETSWWLGQTERLAEDGRRVLGYASGRVTDDIETIPRDLRMLGITGMIDPLRGDIGDAIDRCRQAGIRVVMITGDHPATARTIARHLKLEAAGTVITSSMLHDGVTAAMAATTSVYARVTPEHKLQLVTALQQGGHVVVMTGDGVNDAPALKKADVGVAMGNRGTAVAKDVADVVVLDDSFASIVAAISYGRTIFDNIRSFLIYLLSGNLSELVVIGMTTVLDAPYQLLAMQILFINLLSDVLPALSLAATEGSHDVMERKPRPTSEALVGRRHWAAIVAYGVVMGAASMGAVEAAHMIGSPTPHEEQANNVFFFTLALAQMLHVFVMGSGPRISRAILRNRYVWYALGLNILIMAVLHIPTVTREALGIVDLDPRHWAVVVVMSVGALAVNLVIKRFVRPCPPGHGTSGSSAWV